jgi:hypothetical protein
MICGFIETQFFEKTGFLPVIIYNSFRISIQGIKFLKIFFNEPLAKLAFSSLDLEILF